VNKYWHALNIGFQNHLTYRFNFLARTLFGFIPLLAVVYLWRTIFAGKAADATVSTFTLAEMTSYYLIVTIADALTAVNEDDWQIAADIKDGNISQFLLKPVDYLYFRFCLYLSGRLTYIAVAALPIGLLIFSLREFFVLPADGLTLGLFLVSLIMTAMLQFLLSYAMAMLAFWVLEVPPSFLFSTPLNTLRADTCSRSISCRRSSSKRSTSRRFPISSIFPWAFTWAKSPAPNSFAAW